MSCYSHNAFVAPAGGMAGDKTDRGQDGTEWPPLGVGKRALREGWLARAVYGFMVAAEVGEAVYFGG